MAESVTDHSDVTMESLLQSTSDAEFRKNLHELGLGRGVNVTDTHMWKNKTSFTVRKCDRDNIIETKECGLYEKYEKEVLTIFQDQQKIRLMLDDPSSQIKIGMDAQQTQTVSSSMKISGTKVKTRTISFCTSFKDLPPYIQFNLDRKPSYKLKEDEESFEYQFCLWILNRIEGRLSARNSKYKRSNEKSITDVIFDYFLGNSTSDKETIEQNRREIANDCDVFVRDLGITHYVSSIEMGAMSYNTSTVKSKQKKLGGGVEVHADSYASGGLSGFNQKQWFQSKKEDRLIGKIKDKEVDKGGEAVIGFQIQPIYSLAPVPLLQPALSKAVKEYIQKKADPTEGPYLISCAMTQESSSKGTKSKGTLYEKETDIYWCVSKEDNCIYGTTKISKASKFHTVPTGDPKYPNEFYIVHWRGSRKRLTNVKDPIVQSRANKCHLPLYLTTDTNILGESEGPLQLRSTILTNQARFCLHSRVQSSFAFMMCLSHPVSLNDWIEGEQFYINCSRRAFKMDGYIAMVSVKEPKDTYKFKTATIPSISDPSSNTKGMLFRLQPPPLKKPDKPKLKRSQSIPDNLPSYRSHPMSERQLGPAKPPHTLVTDDPHSDHPPLVHQETAPPSLSSEEEQHKTTTPSKSINALGFLGGLAGVGIGEILLGAALGAAGTPVNNVSTMAGQYKMLYPQDSENEDERSS